jgi:diadenosine tetraphosphate (Ap4A) HIT family hydrolase
MIQGLGVQGTTIFVANGGVAGQRAPHLIVHVIPRMQDDKLFQPHPVTPVDGMPDAPDEGKDDKDDKDDDEGEKKDTPPDKQAAPPKDVDLDAITAVLDG